MNNTLRSQNRPFAVINTAMPSPDEFFNQAIDDYRGGVFTPSGRLLVVGASPVFTFTGWLSKVPVVIGQGVIHKTAKGKHDIDLRQLYNLPSRLVMPVAVFDSDSVTGSFVVVPNVKLSGNPVAVAYAPTVNTRFGSHIEIKSIHARPAQQFERWETAGLLRHLDPGKKCPWR